MTKHSDFTKSMFDNNVLDFVTSNSLPQFSHVAH